MLFRSLFTVFILEPLDKGRRINDSHTYNYNYLFLESQRFDERFLELADAIASTLEPVPPPCGKAD